MKYILPIQMNTILSEELMDFYFVDNAQYAICYESIVKDLLHMSVLETNEEEFRTKQYNLSTLELKYPSNVLVVQSPNPRPLPPLKKDELRFTDIDQALVFAREIAEAGRSSSFSIVVYPGVYVDSLQQIPCKPCSYKLNLEIVGLNNVRILSKTAHTVVQNCNLSLKGLYFYDCREREMERWRWRERWREMHLCTPLIAVGENAKLVLEDVRMNAPGTTCIKAMFRGAKISVSDCMFCDSRVAFSSENGGDIHIKNSIIKNMSLMAGCCGGGHGELSTVIASSIKILSSKHLMVTKGGSASFSEVQMVGDWVPETTPPKEDYSVIPQSIPNNCNGISVLMGGRALVWKSTISGFYIAADCADNDSFLKVQSSIIINCGLAAYLTRNGCAHIHSNVIHCLFSLSEISESIGGSIRFQDNKMLKNTSPRLICGRSCLGPKHDFENASIIIRGETEIDEMQHHTERTRYLKLKSKKKQPARANETLEELEDIMIKHELEVKRVCAHCGSAETPDGSKFKQCNKCKANLVLYCNQECLTHDLPNHKKNHKENGIVLVPKLPSETNCKHSCSHKCLGMDHC